MSSLTANTLPSTPDTAFWQRKLVSISIILGFALISLWGTPFRYDEANSGRYLLEVIQASDPELFAGDTVVQSLQRFESVFYDILALLVDSGEIEPAQIEPLMHALYGLHKITLFLIIFLFARQFSKHIAFFVLLAAWAAHQKAVPVGGNTLFTPQLIHTSIAVSLGILALTSLFSKREIWFWVLVGLAVLTHAIIGFQHFLIVAPVYLWHKRQLTFTDLVGIAFFSVCALVYLIFMTPPPMSPQEAMIFLGSKGAMYHVSPFDHSLYDWARASLVLLLSIVLFHVYLRDNIQARLLVGFVVWGSCAALILGTIAVIFQPVRLAQFQPMRIFFWVWFFAHILIIWATFMAIHQRAITRFYLLGYLLLSITVSLWALPFAGLLLVYLFAKRMARERESRNLSKIDSIARLSIPLVFLLIAGSWLIANLWELPQETLRSSTPLLLLALLALTTFQKMSDMRWQSGLTVLMLVGALVGATLFRHAYYAEREDLDWRLTQLWSRENTEKNASFIVAVESGENFRTQSFRTGIGEPMSALCWVAALECQENSERVGTIRNANRNGSWQLNDLRAIALDWDANYILVEGEVNTTDVPTFRSGPYMIFHVPPD